MKKNLYVDYSQVKEKNFKIILDNFLIKNNQKKLIVNINECLPNYFWDNENIKKKDFKIIKKIIHKIFLDLVKKLEKYHNKKFNQKYWKIILYPWLDAVIPKLYHIWRITLNIEKKYTANIYKYKNEQFISDNFYEMKYYENLDFNRWIVSKTIAYQNRIKYKEKKLTFHKKKEKKFFPIFHYFLIFLFKFFSKIFKTKIMVNRIQLNKLDYIFLNLRLGQFPFFWLNKPLNKIEKINIEKRRLIFLEKNKKKNFINFVKTILLYITPKNYLENFDNINENVKKSYWPKKTKLIMTAVSYWFDDFFKIWAANQTLNDSKYVIFQHGGRMGTEKIISNEDAQIKIADKFITWGWKDKKEKKIIPFYSMLISNLKKKNDYTKAKDIYFCQNIYPNYFSHLDGNPITFKDKIYFTKKANEVFNNLDSSLKKEYVIRYLNSESQGNICHSSLINNKIRQDKGDESLDKVLEKARIFVHDQDRTTFLETLSSNIPTLLVLKKDYCKKRRKESRKYYKDLEKAKIIHTNSISLSNFINKNYSSIDKWWSSEKTQKARSNFCRYYAKKTEKPVQSIINLIEKI
tara:strand:- start:4972 stop:6699 length:1728 start_codon:yes stop_codon:yes gene_type:complete